MGTPDLPLAAALFRSGGRLAPVLFWATFVAWAVGERVIRCLSWRSGRARSVARREDRGSVVVVVAGIVLGLGGGLLVARSRVVPAPGPLIWIILGVVVSWVGILLRWSAVRALGAHFRVVVTVADDQPLIGSGPYRWLRHPAYTGLLLTFTGFGTALGDLAALSIMVGAPAAALVYRIRVEERALAARCGARWDDFAARRARLVPGIW